MLILMCMYMYFSISFCVLTVNMRGIFELNSIDLNNYPFHSELTILQNIQAQMIVNQIFKAIYILLLLF